MQHKQNQNKESDTPSSSQDQWQVPDIDNQQFKSDFYGKKNAEYRDIVSSQSPPSVKELEQIRIDAEQEGAAVGQEQGYQDGFSQGKQEGFSQGYEEGLNQFKAQVSQINDLIFQLNNPLLLLDEEIELQLIELVKSAVSALLHTEMALNQTQITALVQAGIKSLPILSKDIQVELHSDDINIIENALSKAEIKKAQWNLLANDNLHRGGCLIKTNQSQVDLTVEESLRVVFTNLNLAKIELEDSISKKKEVLTSMDSEDSSTIEEVTSEDALSNDIKFNNESMDSEDADFTYIDKSDHKDA